MKQYEGEGQKKKKKLACHEKDELCKHEVCVSDRFMQQVCAQTFKGPRDNYYIETPLDLVSLLRILLALQFVGVKLSW